MTASFTCTSETPWRKGLPTPVIHPKAYETACRDGWPGGDIVTMKFDVCGTQWDMELAQ